MRYEYARLGETPELFRETEEWTKKELEKIKKTEKAREQVMESIQPLLDKKREKIICSQE